MFGMGMPEIILILAIALIVLGPKKLPEIAKSLGRGIAEFKKATQDFKQNIEVDNDFKEAKDTIQGVKGDLQRGIHQTMSDRAPSVDMDTAESKEPVEADAGTSSDGEETASTEEMKDASSGSEPFSPEGDIGEEEDRKEKGPAEDV